ncbi:hypothetical protein LAZ67_X004151 [Cordylochernes scorpioides]|uniref:Retrovirus-related Pol polyprotein from type-1 retrotransposable element R1 n=1 Tax=Cordylochernes scorpioides TaxID=51811 RepID=A0ABY6LVP6_9ARAC|nr:hypothetical protein LAZ67_X004151 [Cordylochernes scorpioides]
MVSVVVVCEVLILYVVVVGVMVSVVVVCEVSIVCVEVVGVVVSVVVVCEVSIVCEVVVSVVVSVVVVCEMLIVCVVVVGVVVSLVVYEVSIVCEVVVGVVVIVVVVVCEMLIVCVVVVGVVVSVVVVCEVLIVCVVVVDVVVIKTSGDWIKCCYHRTHPTTSPDTGAYTKRTLTTVRFSSKSARPQNLVHYAPRACSERGEVIHSTATRSAKKSTLQSCGAFQQGKRPGGMTFSAICSGVSKISSQVRSVGVSQLYGALPSSTCKDALPVQRSSSFPPVPYLIRLEQLLGRDDVLAYADDIVLLTCEDEQLEVVKIFEDLRRASGIRVNFGKKQGFWFTPHCTAVKILVSFTRDEKIILADIEDTLLKTYPFRKRAERVIVTNLPFFVEDAEVIPALRPYGRVTSIAPLLVNVAGFTMKDGRRELKHRRSQGRPCVHYAQHGSTCCSHSGNSARECRWPLPRFPNLSVPDGSEVPESIFAEIEKQGLEREPGIEALQSVSGLKILLPSISDTQRSALNKLARNLMVRIPGSNTPLYKRNEQRVPDYAQDLCLGYSVIVAPPAASRGSGLACLFGRRCLNQYDGGGGGSQQANKRPRSEDEDLLPSSHHQFKFNSTANLFNFECQTFEAIIADTSLDSPEKIQMATKGLILTLVQEAELLLKDAFKGASLGRPNPTANVPIPSTSFASVVAEKDKPVKPAPPKPKAKSTFVNLAPSFESHVVVSCPECPVILPRYCLFRVDGEVRDDEICESFRSNHSVQSLLEKREIRVVHRSNNPAHSTSTVFIEVDNQVAEILGQHGGIPVAGLVHRYERSHTLKQCFRCCGFGHRASACPAAHPICYRCGSAEHEGIRCLVEPSQSRCCRCRKKIWSSHNHFATLSTCAYIPSEIVACSNLHPIPLTSPDTAITSIAICLEQSIIVVHSAYWHGLRAADDFIPLLEDTIRRASLPVILGMDTNAHSPTWGIGARLDFRGANLEEFASFNDLHFLGPPVDSTWSNGPLSSSIDVTLASSSLAIHVTRGLSDEMAFTDHIPIWTTFLDMVNNETKSSWVESSYKEQTFKSFLNSSLHQTLQYYKTVKAVVDPRTESDQKAAIRKAKSKSWFNLCKEVSSAYWSDIHRFIARGRGSPRDEPEFKPWEVLRAIHRCGKRKAPGPDGLDSKCLDLGGPSLQFLLAELFTKCLRMGHFPLQWKEGRLILLPKPSNSATSQLEKYRPITLLNTMAKVFERCILARLQRLADRHGWFFEDQYKTVLGTVNGRSAEDALASITQLIEERQAHWRKTLVISSDISKAFDTVWRQAIIQNLERLNCSESITCLVKSFLEDRTVSYSAWTATECTSSQLGTPQGSALSPFLWNIVARTIFTLPSIIDSRLIAYADDFTLMTQVRSRLPVSATNTFLERLTSWCTINGLNINPIKTQACLFQWRNVHPNSETGLRVLGQPLNIKKTVTILGVEFYQTSGFVAHLRKITRRCRSIIPRLTHTIQGRALSSEGIRQLRSLHWNFGKRVLRGGPYTPTVSAISITGSPPFNIIVRSRTAFLKEINEGNFESRPGPASSPYPPDRRQLSFSQNIEELTTPIIFTDGSKNEAGVGAAIVPSSEDQQPVLLRLHPNCTAFQAELLAIRWAVRLVKEGYSRNAITIASDCRSALSAISTSGPVRSTLLAKIILALNTNQNVNLCWVPGHCGIDGKERADRAAKNAAVLILEPSFSILPRSLARNHSRTAALDAWTEVYCQDHYNRHLRRIAHTPDRLLQFLPKVCPGEVTTTLLTGHGHVRADLVLWRPGEDPSCPHCMEEQQTVDHLLFRCPAFMQHRMKSALLLGKTSFDPVSLAGLPGSLQAWNFLTSWFGSAIDSI